MWECSAPLDAPFRWASFQLSRTVISNAQFHDTSYGTVFPGVLSSLLMLRADCSHLVLLIADATLGWDFSRWAALTYRSIVTDSGIHNDAGVRRAIEEAMAATLIEVQTSPSGTLYAIHRRYWVFAKVQPKWHLYKRAPYDPAADPLDESLSAITTIAQPNGDGVPDNGSAIMMLAQPLKTEVSPPADAITRKAQPLSETPADAGAAITMIAADYHQDSELLSPGEQAAIILIAQPLSESTPSLAPRDAKEIYKEEKELLIERISDESDESSDIEAFAQRYADQQVLQSLLAEHQSLQTLQPGRSGWGAAQRRLRALAPEITRLQAVCTTQVVAPNSDKPEALSSEPGTPDAGRSSAEDQPTLMSGPTAPASEDAADLAARRQRLLALQQELAQLKRTPSMHLMARQRIPRLEEAIKHLLASLAASA